MPTYIPARQLSTQCAEVIWRTLARSLMPALQSWVHFTQRGFISGRIPGHGVIDIDTSGRIVSVLQPLGVLGLFDFSAAFPSISRSFIIFVMRAAGFPVWIISMTSASWVGAKVVSDDGSTAYEMHGGVGQGCPAAAAAFVVGINPFISRLIRHY